MARVAVIVLGVGGASTEVRRALFDQTLHIVS